MLLATHKNGNFELVQGCQFLKLVFVPILTCYESWGMTKNVLSLVQVAEMGFFAENYGILRG